MALKIISAEEGYTLIETLVAMVLFGVALLPLTGVFVTLTENRSAEVLSRALIVATTEIDDVSPDSLSSGSTSGIRDGFIWSRSTLRGERLADLEVRVSKLPDSARVVVILHKSLLLHWKE
jgi:prepilin-type N-terminal cleavage/methylation domain-containing protein